MITNIISKTYTKSTSKQCFTAIEKFVQNIVNSTNLREER